MQGADLSVLFSQQIGSVDGSCIIQGAAACQARARGVFDTEDFEGIFPVQPEVAG